ncbi:glutamate--tRNA ligase family protein [Candidatus Vidania fulgoroideorum]
MKITRFAPSPSGKLHLGNIKSAILSWIYSKNRNGKFYLRIDDTNKKTTNLKYVNQIITDLNWMGIKYNKKFFQSKRKNLYIKYLKNLSYSYKRKDGSWGYFFKKKKISWYENNKKISFETNFNPITIIRKNKNPTYNFCSIIDDIDMKITNIFRSVDHITNTAKQIYILRDLNEKIPNFFHFSNITSDRKKLSKRLGSISLKYYRKIGFLPETILSYILNTGKNNSDELFFLNKVNKFNFKNLKKSPCEFSFDKMLWFNKKILLKKKPILEKKFKKNKLKVFNLFFSRIKVLSDINKILQLIKFKNVIRLQKKNFFFFFYFLLEIYKEPFLKKNINFFFKNLPMKRDFFKFFRNLFVKKLNNLPVVEVIIFLGKKINTVLYKILFI